MEKLHQEIILDIISCLPVVSVLHCKLVCKTWRDLIRLSYFAEMHLRRQLMRLDYDNCSRVAPPIPPPPAAAADNVGFLLLTSMKSSPLCYFEYDENDESYKIVKRINHPPLEKLCFMDAMVGSCNGLVCLSIPCRYGISDPVYICNPITNEYINLPKFNMLCEYKGVDDIDKNSSDEPGRMVSGFGYNASTNEYKVIRIVYCDSITDRAVGRVQVYTLGDGNGWRNKGEITYTLNPGDCAPSVLRGVLANGALHWLDLEEWRIVAFDLEKEEFSLLPPPPCFRPEELNYFQLRVLGGCLCVFQVDIDSYESLNIWSFKKRSFEWEMMFNIPRNDRVLVGPFALTMTGEVLLRYAHETTFFFYDPISRRTEKTIERLEDHVTDYLFLEAIPHMNTFVSLRALGEISWRIR